MAFETSPMTAQEIAAMLSRKRFTLATEKDVQAEIEAVLKSSVPEYRREVELDKKNEIDFMVGTVGIEVKIKGAKSAIYKQLERYAALDEITELIFVTSKTVGIPATINNKSVYVVNMSKAWL
jgi:hypothetical protein